MLELNLVYPGKSDVKYKISKFPDGQQTVDIESSINCIKGNTIKITSRLTSFKDLEVIIAANQALREMGPSSVSLYISYFIGARSDRKFQIGGVNYLKNVICPIINSQKFDCVIVLDPHSDALEMGLNNFEKVNNHLLVKHSLAEIDNKNGAQDRIVLISPDGGAMKKIFDVAMEFKINNVINAVKHRDIKTGKITHTEVPDLSKYSNEHKFVIIDDICDGGRTFIELAKEIRKQNKISEIYLIVTHGIFSAGLLELSYHFTRIFTTNSYSDINVEEFSDYTVSERSFLQFNVL